MSEAKKHGRATNHSMFRMAGRLAQAMPDEFRSLLEILTHDGDVEVIRDLHAAGLMTNTGAQSAVLPLPMYANDSTEALDLIRKILSVDGKLDTRTVLGHFANARDEDSVRVLGMLGCDPNQWLDPNHPVVITPLSTQLSRSTVTGSKPDRLPQIMAILEILRVRGVVPLKEATDRGTPLEKENDIFQCAANRAVNGFSESIYNFVIEELIECDLPDSWRAAAGRAVLESFPVGRMPNQRSQSQLLANLMLIAKFDDSTPWENMLTRIDVKGNTSDMGAWLCDNLQCGSKGIAVVESMLADGLAIDDVTFNLYTGNLMQHGTLLHSAIMRRNSEMVEMLLDAGASPNAVVSAHPTKPPCANPDVGLSAVGLAEKHFPEALPMLHAKKAQDAIARTLEQAARAGNRNNLKGLS